MAISPLTVVNFIAICLAAVHLRSVAGQPQWQQKSKFGSSTPSSQSAWFGASVAIHGNLAVVGAPQESSAFLKSGAAHVYLKENGSWVFLSRLKLGAASTDFPPLQTEFGFAVAVYGNTIVVSAPAGVYDRSAWIFEYDEQSRAVQFVQKLQGDDNDGNNITLNVVDVFGVSVDIYQDMLVVGSVSTNVDSSPEAFYVFKKSGNTWKKTARVNSPNPSVVEGFGLDVGIHKNTIVVGAPRSNSTDDTTVEAGSAYVFESSLQDTASSSWQLSAKLQHVAFDQSDFFGFSTAVFDDIIAVGVPGEEGPLPASQTNYGAVYMYQRNAEGVWEETERLWAIGTGSLPQTFGSSVDLYERQLVVGASTFDFIRNNTVYENAGAVFVYQQESENGKWLRVFDFYAEDDFAAGERLGGAVAIHEKTILAGAERADWGIFVDSGAAYILEDVGDGQTSTTATPTAATPTSAPFLSGIPPKKVLPDLASKDDSAKLFNDEERGNLKRRRRGLRGNE